MTQQGVVNRRSCALSYRAAGASDLADPTLALGKGHVAFWPKACLLIRIKRSLLIVAFGRCGAVFYPDDPWLSRRGCPLQGLQRQHAAAVEAPEVRPGARSCGAGCYAAPSGRARAASNCSSAHSISPRVITRGGLTRMVWLWVSLHRTPRRRSASQ